MDKYELVLDIIEHSGKYSAEQLSDILSDPEKREIYNLLCKVDTALKDCPEIDVDAEWRTFSHTYTVRSHRHFRLFGSRAAAIAAIICTSIIAMIAGIAVTGSLIDHRSAPDNPATTGVIDSRMTVPVETIALEVDEMNAEQNPIIFENETLGVIMAHVGEVYGIDVKFNDDEASSLHLYYRFDPSLSLDEVVAQLNTFNCINISRNGKTLFID
ncbi:MAG: DUF4974 domain-containing protein [Muribaculaceae bacterium]|nr:DUF4974 domain-containing protein [Muribaculaceae bacterium]